MKPIAQRMDVISPHFFASLNTKIAGMQASGHDVIRLDEGSPDMPPSPAIISALVEAASAPQNHSYQPHSGTKALRSAWAEMYARLYKVELDPDREIVPLLGSKEGIFHLSLALVNPGDIVLVPNPGYVTYSRGTMIAGGTVYDIPLLPERNFLPDFKAIPPEITRKAKIIWLNYPNNPTGATATLDFFTEAVEYASKNNLILCHDAAYSQVTYDGYTAPSVLQVMGAKDIAIEFNSLSKSHNMAGWRVGAALGNQDILRVLYTLKTNADSGHFLPILHAASVALTTDQSWLKERNDTYRQRRDRMLTGLRAMGLNPSTPSGSLYIWCPTFEGWSSIEFTTAILEQAHVSLSPGVVFGQYGEGYMRISITAPIERIDQAVQRLHDWRNNGTSLPDVR